MRYIANCTVLATTPQASKHFDLWPLEAENEIAAARMAAEGVAKAVYGAFGAASSVEPQDDDENLFLASVGEYHNGVTRGSTLSILIREYHAS